MRILKLIAAMALLAVPISAAAQNVVRTGDNVPGQPGAAPVTATDGRTAKVPVYIPVRADGTVIDPAGGGGGSVPTGTAGTPNAAVVTVQGITGGTAIPVNDNAGSLTVDTGTPGTFAVTAQGAVAAGATSSGNPVPIGGVFNTALPTYTTGQRSDLQSSSRGELYTMLSVNGSQPTALSPSSDGIAAGVGLRVINHNLLFNGSGWDRTAGNVNGTFVQPARATSTISNGTVATGGTFVSALAANTTRRGCTIQNKSTTTMQFFLGAPGSGTTATSFDVPAGGTFSCIAAGGIILTDQISVTSATAGAAFVVSAQ